MADLSQLDCARLRELEEEILDRMEEHRQIQYRAMFDKEPKPDLMRDHRRGTLQTELNIGGLRHSAPEEAGV